MALSQLPWAEGSALMGTASGSSSVPLTSSWDRVLSLSASRSSQADRNLHTSPLPSRVCTVGALASPGLSEGCVHPRGPLKDPGMALSPWRRLCRRAWVRAGTSHGMTPSTGSRGSVSFAYFLSLLLLALGNFLCPFFYCPSSPHPCAPPSASFIGSSFEGCYQPCGPTARLPTG